MAVLFKNSILVSKLSHHEHSRRKLQGLSVLKGNSLRFLLSLVRTASSEPTCLRHNSNSAANLDVLPKGTFFTNTQREEVHVHLIRSDHL